MTLRIGVLTTHPIQYQVPWFRLLANKPHIDLHVLYCMQPNATQQGDGFGVKFQWDIPLLDGYSYRFLDNVSSQPSVTQFSGCDTPSIFKEVRSKHWDAFIVNGWVTKSCLQLLAACRLYKVPCIVRGEANLLRKREPWKKRLQRLLVHQYSAFLSIGKANTAFYREHGIPMQKIFDTPYCIENTRFTEGASRARSKRAELRRKFGLQEETFTFLYCGKFVDKKRPLDLLRALRRLHQTPRVEGQLLMVGDGHLRSECEDFVQQTNLPVQFSGFLNQQEIIEAYAVSDCLVLPSDAGETWGLVANEAMACGLTAIVSDQVGCSLDLVQDDHTGYVYPVGDIPKLATHMRTLAVANPQKSQTLGANAQQRVLDHYNYESVVSGIDRALEYLL